MDEVGRGTTVKDGIAIAFATIFHLCSYTRCRTLFATHFHELADMLGYSNETHQSLDCRGVAFFCTDVHQSEVSCAVVWILSSRLNIHVGWPCNLLTSPAPWG